MIERGTLESCTSKTSQPILTAFRQPDGRESGVDHPSDVCEHSKMHP